MRSSAVTVMVAWWVLGCGGSTTASKSLNLDAKKDASLSRRALAVSGSTQVVAWSEVGPSDTSLVHVKRSKVTGWDVLGGALNVEATHEVGVPAIAIAGDAIAVAFTEYDATGLPVLFVKSWDGSAWVQLGAALSTRRVVGAPSIAMRSATEVVVAWAEMNGSNSDVLVRRWDGASWAALGAALDVGVRSAENPSIAIDAMRRVVVAWSEADADDLDTNVYVKQWDGAAWTQLGAELDLVNDKSGSAPSLALDGAGVPTVAWTENSATADRKELFVKRWFNGAWTQLGGAVNVQSAFNPSLSLSSEGTPFVACDEAGNVEVRSLVAGQWTSALTATTGNTPSLVIDQAVPRLAYLASSQVFVVP